MEKIKAIFRKNPLIKLAYLFGSQASGTAGPMSDFDFAVFLDTRNRDKMFSIKLELISALTQALETDKVDIVVLNAVEQPELKFNIINEGRLIYQVEPFRVAVEPKILNEYFDFHFTLKRYNLTNG